jgi:tyrosyl-tRNA synthetase
MKTSDADVGRYLKLFTLLPLEHIQQVLEDHKVSDTKSAAFYSDGNLIETTRRTQRPNPFG